MYKKIMVGYDGTPFSDCALKEAIALAKKSGGKLLLVSAPEITVDPHSLAPGATDFIKKDARAVLDQAAARVKKAGLTCETKIVISTSTEEALLETAQKKKINLIILGTHGRTGLRRLLMGSTTAGVIGHASCTVMVVPCP